MGDAPALASRVKLELGFITIDAPDALKWLDDAARVNLPPDGYVKYQEYRDGLLAEGRNLDDIEVILRGFIWGEIEEDASS